jgi:hypothetical protein
MVLDRKVVPEFEGGPPGENVLLEVPSLIFHDRRAARYRVNERLPDIDGS